MKTEKVWITKLEGSNSVVFYSAAGAHKKKTVEEFRNTPGAERVRNWIQEQEKKK